MIQSLRVGDRVRLRNAGMNLYHRDMKPGDTATVTAVKPGLMVDVRWDRATAKAGGWLNERFEPIPKFKKGDRVRIAKVGNYDNAKWVGRVFTVAEDSRSYGTKLHDGGNRPDAYVGDFFWPTDLLEPVKPLNMHINITGNAAQAKAALDPNAEAEKVHRNLKKQAKTLREYADALDAVAADGLGLHYSMKHAEKIGAKIEEVFKTLV